MLCVTACVINILRLTYGLINIHLWYINSFDLRKTRALSTLWKPTDTPEALKYYDASPRLTKLGFQPLSLKSRITWLLKPLRCSCISISLCSLFNRSHPSVSDKPRQCAWFNSRFQKGMCSIISSVLYSLSVDSDFWHNKTAAMSRIRG